MQRPKESGVKCFNKANNYKVKNTDSNYPDQNKTKDTFTV